MQIVIHWLGMSGPQEVCEDIQDEESDLSFIPSFVDSSCAILVTSRIFCALCGSSSMILKFMLKPDVTGRWTENVKKKKKRVPAAAWSCLVWFGTGSFVATLHPALGPQVW